MDDREAGGQAEGDGLFVVFEGIHGAGTTTQLGRYAAHLRSRRRLVHVTREPSGGPIGSLIRLVLTQRVVMPATNHAEALALLFAADRLDHVEAEVAPFLRDGYVVLSDRYDLSSIIYQAVMASPASPDPAAWIRAINRHARRPDVTVVLDIAPEVAETRRKSKDGAATIFDDPEIQTAAAKAYAEAHRTVAPDRVIHVDANLDEATVAARILEALEPTIAARVNETTGGADPRRSP